MHNNWEELIPYYVAGSLAKPDADRLERHLAGCAPCRQSLVEWRAVAAAVRADAAGQLRALPPLAPHVLQIAAAEAPNRQIGGRRWTPAEPRPVAVLPRTRPRYTPITLVAALLTVALIGGVLGLMVLRTLPERGAEGVALLPTDPMTTAFATRNPTEPPFQGEIIVIEPTVTPLSPTLTPIAPIIVQPTSRAPVYIAPTPLPPTSLPPPTISMFAPPNATPTLAGTPQLRSITAQCTAQAAVAGRVVNLYAEADVQSAVITTFTQADTLTVTARSATGWLQVTLGRATGWVLPDQVFTSGNCDVLPVIDTRAPTESPVTPPATPLPFPADNGGSLTSGTLTSAWVTIPSGAWSLARTVTQDDCRITSGPTTETVTIYASGDTITVSGANSFILSRTGGQTYTGRYSAADFTISVTVTFTGTSFSGSETTIGNGGCIVRETWSGTYSG